MKFYIKTYGCTANKSDSEIIAGILLNNNYKLVKSIEDANIIIVNTCSVKHTTEEKIISFLKKLNEKLKKEWKDKKVIIAGCLVDTNLERIIKAIPNYFSIINVKAIDKIVEAVKKKGIYIGEQTVNKLSLPAYSFSKVIGIVQIGEGCLGSCSYCSTRFARRQLRSFKIEEIVKKVKSYIKEGKKEIWLTSQDNGVYGFDINTNLANLLKEIDKIEGKFKVRVGMANPFGVKRMLDELIDAYKSEKIFKFIHLPLQSGSDKVLKEMNRYYTVDDFIKIIKNFRENFKDITIATDIIVGYPTESEEDFEKTIKVIKKVKPDIVNISAFSSRPKTKASKLKKLDTKIVKERLIKLSKICNQISYKKLEKFIGKVKEVLIDEKVNCQYIGRDENYRAIHLKEELKGPSSLLGKFVKVKIVGRKIHYLIGEIKD